MAKAPHKKPTRPFGTIVFGKDGSVRREVLELPESTVGQEESVVRFLCDGLRQHHGRNMDAVRSLAERDHDASAVVEGRLVQLQVAEIVQRGFELPAGVPNRGDPKAIAFFDATSPNATSLDLDRLRDSVLLAIERKVQKHYAKPADSSLWLVLFTTSSFISMEYWENGQLAVGDPLRVAREHFRRTSWEPFDEIWFTDLKTRPVRVLPESSSEP